METIKILHAEDDSAFARLTHKILTKQGFKVEIALDGNEALALFQRKRPDLLLLDLSMPGRSGQSVVEKIKKIEPDFPIIIYSSHADPDIVVQAIDLGVEDYINKDCDVNIFISKLNNIIKRNRRGMEQKHIIELSPITSFNIQTETLTMNGNVIKIKPMDARLLKLLAIRFNEWADSEYLVLGMWRFPKKIDELKKYVLHLRKIFKNDPDLYIENQWGGFYRLTNQPGATEYNL